LQALKGHGLSRIKSTRNSNVSLMGTGRWHLLQIGPHRNCRGQRRRRPVHHTRLTSNGCRGYLQRTNLCETSRSEVRGHGGHVDIAGGRAYNWMLLRSLSISHHIGSHHHGLASTRGRSRITTIHRTASFETNESTPTSSKSWLRGHIVYMMWYGTLPRTSTMLLLLWVMLLLLLLHHELRLLLLHVWWNVLGRRLGKLLTIWCMRL
jgi:hypothetical protein